LFNLFPMTAYAFVIVLWISFFVSFICSKDLKPDYIKLFIPFLFVTSLVETTGLILTKKLINNTKLYNVFTPLEFMFYGYIYYHCISSPKAKKTIIAFFIFYPLITFINQYCIQGFKVFHTNTYLFGAFFIIILSLLYITQLLRSDSTQNPLSHHLFWISAGLLFFYACNFPYLMLMNYLVKNNIKLAITYFPIIHILNIILYIMFITGFLCKRIIPR